jgi:hypothetical protein
MEVYYITWDGADYRRWCVTCPSLPANDQYERRQWCYSQDMDFVNIGVRFWFAEEKEVMLFKLRWS